MKILKKNQLILFVVALMLVTAGYLNFTSQNTATIETQGSITDDPIASIGDATLVSSNSLVDNEENIITSTQEKNSVENEVSSSISTDSTNTVATNATAITDDYFTDSRLQREKMYSQMIESYQKITESTTTSEEQKTSATQEIGKINQTRNAIMIAENLIKTKGIKDLVIFVNDDSISVIVNSEDLQPEQIAQIQNIISRELKADVDNIHISSK